MGQAFPTGAQKENPSRNENEFRDAFSAIYRRRLVAFVKEAFDGSRDALGALGRYVDKVGRTHESILVHVLAHSAQRLFVVARRKRKVTVVLGEDGKTRDLLGAA